jgi:hypothetical protein
LRAFEIRLSAAMMKLGFKQSSVTAMSNVFRAVYTFVPVVQRWQPGQKLSPSLLNFHDCLCYMAYTFSTVCFENIPNSLFADLRHMSADAVERGRIEAAARKWISYKKGYRNTYTYWFLDEGGREFVPTPETKPGHSWRYQADNWWKHLARRRNLSKTPASWEALTFGKRQRLENLSSVFTRSSSRKPRENPQADCRQVPANQPLASKQRPLECSNSDEFVSSEGVVLRAECGSKENCISPTWDELGSLRAQKKIIDGNTGTCTGADELSLFSHEIRPVTRERTMEELLRDIQADRQARSVMGALSRRFGAKIVEVRDTKVSH